MKVITGRCGENIRLELPFTTTSDPQVPFWYWVSRDEANAPRPGVDAALWWEYVGDWWGARDSAASYPDPFEVECPPRWSVKECDAMPGRDWRFAYLIRNPMDHLASMMKMTGELANPLRQQDEMEYFRCKCLGVRNRYIVAADCANRMDNFQFVRFEDLIDDPLTTITNLFEWFGLNADHEKLQAEIQFQADGSYATRCSMFKDRDHFNRWSYWTDEMVQVFKDLCGEATEAAGYKLP